MTFRPSTSHVARRIGVALTALTFGATALTPPSQAAPAKDSADCIDYGDVAVAPEGFIPRDDLHVVRKDPLVKAAKSTTKGSSRGKVAAAAALESATIPVRFHVISKDNGGGGGNLSDACMTEFTAGQAARMQTAWTAYRDLS